MELARFQAEADVEDIAAAIRRDGAAIVERFADPDIVDAVKTDLRPKFDAEGRETENDFNGYRTLRVNSCLEFSRASAELIGHRRMCAVIDRILLLYCLAYQIGSSTAIEIHPGESEQRLHRDDGIYPVRLPGLELQMSVMWTLDDFTIENGATRIAPGATAGSTTARRVTTTSWSRRRCQGPRRCSISARSGTAAAPTAPTRRAPAWSPPIPSGGCARR